MQVHTIYTTESVGTLSESRETSAMSWSPKYTSTGSKCDGEPPAITALCGVVDQVPEERGVPGGLDVGAWPEANHCSRWEEY